VTHMNNDKLALQSSAEQDEATALDQWSSLATEIKSYDIRRYSDASAVGTIDMTSKQFARYLRSADKDTGVITLADLMDIVGDGNQYDAVTLIHEDQDTSITVYAE